MDEDNPTLREWCLMIIRNICQASDEVRQLLDSIRKVDKDNVEVIESLGLKSQYQKE